MADRQCVLGGYCFTGVQHDVLSYLSLCLVFESFTAPILHSLLLGGIRTKSLNTLVEAQCILKTLNPKPLPKCLYFSMGNMVVKPPARGKVVP